MKRLGGWWRIWIALSAIWLVILVAAGIFLGLDAYKAFKEARASYAAVTLHCDDGNRHTSHGPWEHYAPQSAQYIVSSPSGAHYSVTAPISATTSQVMAFAELLEAFTDTKGHAMPWRQIMQAPEYQALPEDQREAVREEYFRGVVAPQIRDPAQQLQAKQEFDTEFGSQANPHANPFDQFDPAPWQVRSLSIADEYHVGDTATSTRSAWSVNPCINDQQLASNAAQIASIKTNAVIYLLMTLAPPIILLLLGLLVSWVLSGFRKAPT